MQRLLRGRQGRSSTAKGGRPQGLGHSALGRASPSAPDTEMLGEGLDWPKSGGLPTTDSERWLREERQPQTLATLGGEAGAPVRHHGGKSL